MSDWRTLASSIETGTVGDSLRCVFVHFGFLENSAYFQNTVATLFS
jgi:hypothetical protein